MEYGLYNKEPVIRTFTGLWMNVFEPTEDMICIEDIAHALSQLCRWGGHSPTFYSVAQHSNHCCHIATKEHKLAALLHDASEAYLIDVPRPIKLKLPMYKTIEDKLMGLIAEKFGFQYPLHPAVKNIDELALNMEWEELILHNKSNKANCMLDAEDQFLMYYINLSRKS